MKRPRWWWTAVCASNFRFGETLRLWNRHKRGVDLNAIHALHPISFSVPKGQKIGILGRNGSGKSTLLKLLARITEPSSGEAIIRGRVASILEVGTGFHPELTGAENVFLNGAILGLKREFILSRMTPSSNSLNLATT